MHRNRKTKLVATLGPASSGPDTLREMFDAGADVFRLNFSHGNHAEFARRVAAIRDLEDLVGRPVGILADIQGPKLRLGRIESGSVLIDRGAALRLDLGPDPGNSRRVPLPHPEIFSALQPDSELMIDDGRIRLRVVRCAGDHAETEVIVGGRLGNYKGVNVPDLVLPISVITEKDRRDVEWALEQGADWIAQSFVQRPGDVAELRALTGRQVKIMVKLEKPSALDCLDEILEICDGVMVARGDLGVELPPQRVPVVQKSIIRRARQIGKPVVIATHMLDSMVTNPVPTRAEASDVATAVYDGVDAVMLSAESAAGEYPVASVQMMNRIIEEVEADPMYRDILDSQRPEPENTTADAICNGLQRITGILSSAATVTYTASGSTSLRAARERPEAPILSLTPFPETARHLAIVWGIHAVTVDVAHEGAEFLEVISAAMEIAEREMFARTGQDIVIAAGLPFGISGTTNLIHVARIGTDNVRQET